MKNKTLKNILAVLLVLTVGMCLIHAQDVPTDYTVNAGNRNIFSIGAKLTTGVKAIGWLFVGLAGVIGASVWKVNKGLAIGSLCAAGLLGTILAIIQAIQSFTS